VGFEGRAAIGYNHDYDAEVLCLELALDPIKYVDGFVEGCLERIGEHEPRRRESAGRVGGRG
jgi:hypothetical protein